MISLIDIARAKISIGGMSVSDTTNELLGMNNFARTSNCGVLFELHKFHLPMPIAAW